jgi:transposase
VSTIS